MICKRSYIRVPARIFADLPTCFSKPDFRKPEVKRVKNSQSASESRAGEILTGAWEPLKFVVWRGFWLQVVNASRSDGCMPVLQAVST